MLHVYMKTVFLFIAGILVDPFQWFNFVSKEPYYWPSVLLVLVGNVFILVAFMVEIYLSKVNVFRINRWLSDCESS